MGRLIFASQAAFDRAKADIEVTPNLQGGAGPVMLGAPAVLPDGRLTLVHPFREVDLDWFEAYANDPGVTVEGDGV